MPLNKQSIFSESEFDYAILETNQPLTLFRRTLSQGQGILKEHFFNKVNITQIVNTHAWFIDQLVTRAWQYHIDKYKVDSEITLVAVGGYGRGELHPSSDIDIMILMYRDKTKKLKSFIEALLQFYWDLGLDIGHSVRSLKQCVNEAKKDITVVTNLMEARFLSGSETLFNQMKLKTQAERIWSSKKFFSAKWREQITRHRNFEDTAYNLEPNIKEGPGGLRDIQMIAWVTQRHFDTTSLHDLVAKDFLSESEYRSLIRGRNFLWQIRCGLHYFAERREDRLLFDYQRMLATFLDYKDKPGILAVEQFMKRYYRTVKELSLLNEILLQHFQEAILTRWRTKSNDLNSRFKITNEFIEIRRHDVFSRRPSALLELFQLMQQNPKINGVRASTIRSLRENLFRIDTKFRRNMVNRSLFMEILRHPDGVYHTLRRMNAYGVLGSYLPAFGGIVGQMQHDLFHVYTVDEHTLFVIRNIRRFGVAEYRHEFPLASELIQHIPKPERLYLAALFHDIAKGRGGDHSTLGEKDAREFCELHKLSEYDTRIICWLVRQHLLMSFTSQREDITDPEVVYRFACKVGDQEHLDYLYLLTVADIRGTSPKVWNEWKGRLLSQLYTATTRMLRRGVATPIDLEAHTEDLKNEALILLKNSNLTKKAVVQFWSGIEDDYFIRYNAEGIAWHASIIAAAKMEDLPLVAARTLTDGSGTECLIYTQDRVDLFVMLTAIIDQLNLNIVDARIHTTQTSFALDTFVVLDHNHRPLKDAAQLRQLEKTIRKQLRGPKLSHSIRSNPFSRQQKHFPIQPTVNFSTSVDQRHTVMELTAQDQRGLLYRVALALKVCEINLDAARISTFGERAEDVFFLSNRDGRPLANADQLRCVTREIQQRLIPTAEPVRSLSF